jgi:hypothetical protein
MKFRFFVVPAVAALLLAACQPASSTPPAVVGTAPVTATETALPVEEPVQTEKPAQTPAPTAVVTEAPTGIGAATLTDTPVPTQVPTPYPLIGEGQPLPLEGIFAAVIDGFDPEEEVSIEVLDADGNAVRDAHTTKVDRQGRALVTTWSVQGDMLPEGTYTCTVTGQQKQISLPFEVADVAYQMPDTVECRVVPDDLHLYGNAVIWCWGTPIGERTAFRFEAGGASSELSVVSPGHLAVLPVVLTPDGLPAGDWLLTVFSDTGEQIAQYTLEVSE